MVVETGRKKTILAVDDTPENLDVIKAILVPEFAVKIATSGPTALKIAEAQTPDLILLDVMMPGMDGYEVCRRLKDNPATRDIPIIFVTARDQVEDEARGLSVGAADYIAKPIKPPILRARLQTQLDLADAIRTLAIQNRALVEAARLREDVEHITRHDLKSPLNIIIGVPQLLLMQDNIADKDREYLKMIEVSGYRMLSMINRSLDLFKMENGTYVLEPEPVDLVAVMRGVLIELETMLSAKAITVRLRVDGRQTAGDEPLRALGESLLCHSMFANLCKNAVEAAPQRDVITIDIRSGARIVTAIDNGGEVPSAIRGTFFQKFVTFGKRTGTGLGTYSAMLIARTLRGSIDLDTITPGRTCVRVTLPAFSVDTRAVAELEGAAAR